MLTTSTRLNEGTYEITTPMVLNIGALRPDEPKKPSQ